LRSHPISIPENQKKETTDLNENLDSNSASQTDSKKRKRTTDVDVSNILNSERTKKNKN